MPPDDDNENNTPGLSKGQGVIIYAENKRYPIAVGVMTMSSLEMYVLGGHLRCSL
jgi:PUA domain protein